MTGNVAALIDRSGAQFPDVDPSTVALLLLAMRAGRMTEASTRELLAERGIESLWGGDFPHIEVFFENLGRRVQNFRVTPGSAPSRCPTPSCAGSGPPTST